MFDPRNVARDNLDSILEAMGQKKAGSGFHIFRRFREYILQRSEARPILVNYWMGIRTSLWKTGAVGRSLNIQSSG